MNLQESTISGYFKYMDACVCICVYIIYNHRKPFVSSDDFDEAIKLALALSAEEAKEPTAFDQGGSRYSSFQQLPQRAHSS